MKVNKNLVRVLSLGLLFTIVSIMVISCSEGPSTEDKLEYFDNMEYIVEESTKVLNDSTDFIDKLYSRLSIDNVDETMNDLIRSQEWGTSRLSYLLKQTQSYEIPKGFEKLHMYTERYIDSLLRYFECTVRQIRSDNNVDSCSVYIGTAESWAEKALEEAVILSKDLY